jgi:hypothetical protein
VKFRRSVDVAQETFSEIGADSDFNFGGEFLGDLLTAAWTHKSDSEPRKDARAEIRAIIQVETTRRASTHGD